MKNWNAPEVKEISIDQTAYTYHEGHILTCAINEGGVCNCGAEQSNKS